MSSNISQLKSNSTEVMEKPKRPLSAYNYFFQHQRKQLLGPSFSEKGEESDPKRRVHRKTHGKYSFGEMARVIAQKWKNLDEATRFEFEDLAAEDKKRYKQQMKIWKKGSKQEQQQHKKETEKLQQQQEHIWQEASLTDTKKNDEKSDSDHVEAVTSADPPASPVSEKSAQLKASRESDGEREEVHESTEAKLHRLLLQRERENAAAAAAAAPADIFDGGLTRNAVAAAAASAATVAALSSLDNRSAVLRTLAGDGDDACAAAALTAINAQRIREERMHQAKMKELLNLQMLGMESQRERETSFLERSLRTQAHDPLARLRNDPLSNLLQGNSATRNFDGLAPSDIRTLALEARLRNGPVSHPFLAPTPPVTESMDSRLAAYLARGGMM